MPLFPIDTTQPSKKFLQDILDNSSQVLKEYDNNKKDLYIYESAGCIGWWITIPYRFGLTENSKHLPSLIDILNTTKDKTNLLMVMISDVTPGIPQSPHTEELPEGISRYHIPIKYNPTARLNVLTNGEYKAYEWTDHNVFEFDEAGNPHYITCPGGDNRIVIMVDLFDGDITEQQLKDIEQWYVDWEDSVPYHQVKMA